VTIPSMSRLLRALARRSAVVIYIRKQSKEKKRTVKFSTANFSLSEIPATNPLILPTLQSSVAGLPDIRRRKTHPAPTTTTSLVTLAMQKMLRNQTKGGRE